MRAQMNMMYLAIALLGGVALVKIVLAFSRGRTNVWFLIILAAVACGIAVWICRRRITAAGGELLGELRVLLRRLEARAGQLAAGGATNEALLLAAAFGLYALPASAFPFIEQLFPQPKASPNDSSNSGSSCSSSCGSSCGGGSGCGGCGS